MEASAAILSTTLIFYLNKTAIL